MTTEIEQYTEAMAELVVRFGANVQPGQVVAIGASRARSRWSARSPSTPIAPAPSSST